MFLCILLVFLAPEISAEVRHCLFLIIINRMPPHLPQQEQIRVFSNYNDGLLKRGKEEVVTNYMELSEDPIG